MKLHKEARNLTKELFHASFTDGRIDPVKVRRITQQLVEHKPRFYIEILRAYQRLLRLEIEKNHAVVESAQPLDALSRYEVERDLKKKFGAELSTEFKVNPDLIGGLRVRIGSNVWDGSIKARLEALQNELASA